MALQYKVDLIPTDESLDKALRALQEQAVRELLGSVPAPPGGVPDVCVKCGSEVDYNTCWCGIESQRHALETHGFVPMGCDCLRAEVATPPLDLEVTNDELPKTHVVDGTRTPWDLY